MTAGGQVNQHQSDHQRHARGPKHDPGPAGRIDFGLRHVAQRAEQVEVVALGQSGPRRGAHPRFQLRLIQQRLPSPEIALPVPGELAGEAGRVGRHVLVGRQDELPVHPPHPKVGPEVGEFEAKRAARRPSLGKMVLQLDQETTLVALAGQRHQQPVIGYRPAFDALPVHQHHGLAGRGSGRKDHFQFFAIGGELVGCPILPRRPT